MKRVCKEIEEGRKPKAGNPAVCGLTHNRLDFRPLTYLTTPDMRHHQDGAKKMLQKDICRAKCIPYLGAH